MSNPPLLQTGSQLIRSSLRRGQPEGGDAAESLRNARYSHLCALESPAEGNNPNPPI